jgi:hypothetical protein
MIDEPEDQKQEDGEDERTHPNRNLIPSQFTKDCQSDAPEKPYYDDLLELPRLEP